MRITAVPDVGSVTFQPLTDPHRGLGLKVWRGPWQGTEWDAFVVWGWCTVVVKRDTWVTTTRVEPAIECCNAMQPAIWHLTQMHDHEGGEGSWEFKLKMPHPGGAA